MLYRGSDTQKSVVGIQTKYEDAFRLLDGKSGLLYHYAGIETIWKILETDSFLARNVRFSNDSQEYKLGESIIKEYIGEKYAGDKTGGAQLQQKIFKSIQQGMQMFYMICFCKKGDLLSQWRGYAKNGVSLGLDFFEEEETQKRKEHTEIFTVLNNQNNRSDDKYELDDNYVRFVEMPYRVFYISNDKKDERSEREKLWKAMKKFDGDPDTGNDMLLNLIPFIKDAGFKEEAEYRILFSIRDLGNTEAQNRIIMNKKVEYIMRDNQKLPNIVVEVGDGEKKQKPVEKVIMGKQIEIRAKKQGRKKDEIDLIYHNIQTKLLSGNVSSIRCDEKQDIYIGEGNNQEEIMRMLEDTMEEEGFSIDCEEGIKIWCRGHLPIREVIIGPGEKQEKIGESLKHFMRNTYWLRYVDVKYSKIPLQN